MKKKIILMMNKIGDRKGINISIQRHFQSDVGFESEWYTCGGVEFIIIFHYESDYELLCEKLSDTHGEFEMINQQEFDCLIK